MKTRKYIVATAVIGIGIFLINCAGVVRQQNADAKIDEKVAALVDSLGQNPEKFKSLEGVIYDFVKVRALTSSQGGTAAVHKNIRVDSEDKLRESPSPNTPTPATPIHAEFKGTYYDSARDVYHLAQDTDGYIEVSENGAYLIGCYLEDTGNSTERDMGKKLYVQKLELLKKALQ
ncbi:hypothetical protein COU24_02885 [Candidatus Kuenenbacteria bacterium CG10_big_fil_rev_8_21_14_0_10_39_14]|uniref:Uncharacterized protein n=2 Tax=Candidatus Kueneniibacteriota TaxID=1752740 RepID=A0A2H0D0P0_9BACT|nr:MAG: hypothetical protein COW86_05210 [Candidatus Kuenenbacteria bacterium CG22_combo_CG10-13_8_21_14_all_39_9]PIR80642.1 MAG: hypothetical protein COU24_02885 [Candidatus Kuenenbacteria bacterium CG10_big_fil_rev_8_21_14_0_10_39_14]